MNLIAKYNAYYCSAVNVMGARPSKYLSRDASDSYEKAVIQRTSIRLRGYIKPFIFQNTRSGSLRVSKLKVVIQLQGKMNSCRLQ
jgi:hypothetical protein